MNSGQTSERVYETLKDQLLRGAFSPGARLDPTVLSVALSSSVTPVRDALNQLIGEGLVETRTGEGFHRPHLTAPDLQDLYRWAEQVMALAVRGWRQETAVRRIDAVPGIDPADRAARLCAEIGRRSRNLEHGRAILAINDRLHAVRRLEPLALGDVTPELDAIAGGLDGDRRSLLRLLGGYFRRRARLAHEIVRAAYRDA
jgi:hypothetical protein